MSDARAEAIAAECVRRLIADISDRRGLKNEWDAIEPWVHAEISAAWLGIIADEVSAHLVPTYPTGDEKEATV